ncbi:sulfotransferase domain-containing protein [Elongatibacter sediminis]
MPKSGSTLLANYQEQLLEMTGQQSGQDALKRAFGGRYVAEPRLTALIRLLGINFLSGTVVVKNHWELTALLKSFVKLGVVKVTMNFRDPRDVILSALDHGRRSRAKGVKTGEFTEYHSVVDSIPFVKKLVSVFIAWSDYSPVHLIKYEDLISEPVTELKKMAAFLEWEVSEDQVRSVVQHQRTVRKEALNFNKGTTQRWKVEMTDDEVAQTTKAFEPFLTQMDYEISI